MNVTVEQLIVIGISVAVGLFAGIAVTCITTTINKSSKKAAASAGDNLSTAQTEGNRKTEFTKIFLTLILCTYLIGLYVGIKIVLMDYSQLSVLLAYIGTPTTAGLGFYCWKSKAENMIKLKKAYPQETEGISIDLNSIQP